MARTEDQRFTVSESMTIGFIGAGRMAQAMSRGFISKGEDIFILKGQPELSAVKGNHSNINIRQNLHHHQNMYTIWKLNKAIDFLADMT